MSRHSDPDKYATTGQSGWSTPTVAEILEAHRRIKAIADSMVQVLLVTEQCWQALKRHCLPGTPADRLAGLPVEVYATLSEVLTRARELTSQGIKFAAFDDNGRPAQST